MSDRIFVLVADGDIFNKIFIESSSPIAERYYAGLSSNPIFVECSSLFVKVGDIWDGENFYAADDIEKINPRGLIENHEELPQMAQYAMIADGDVFGKISLELDHERINMFIAGMSSNPVCVESTEYPAVDIGWTWDGTIFYPPQE